MLQIVICEDIPKYRVQMGRIVSKYIANKDSEIEIALSTGSPTDVLDYLKKHPDRRGLYFLDINLHDKHLDGIILGLKIREADPMAKIVFVTTHQEAAVLTYEHKIEAMDFIVKGNLENMERRMVECIIAANRRYLKERVENTKHFRVTANGEVWNIPHDEILFFETHPKVRERMILRMENGKVDFRGIISEVSELVPKFYRCHKSYILNPGKVIRINKDTKQAIMADESCVPVSAKKLSELLRVMEQGG
ncbi:MAG: LytTR family DNA-binding domain-containing protein [Defluviitaleaceae bacterium]|nr:LytTR family DNA-binding domain-containing protein [Defluviitaleaceae bacterium]